MELASIDELTFKAARSLVDRIHRKLGDIRQDLTTLRERNGWKVLGYRTWEAMVDAEFGMSREHAHRLIDANVIDEILELPIGNANGAHHPLPESHARELVPFKHQPEVVREIYYEVQERTHGRARAADYREAVGRRRHPPSPAEDECFDDETEIVDETEDSDQGEATEEEGDSLSDASPRWIREDNFPALELEGWTAEQVAEAKALVDSLDDDPTLALDLAVQPVVDPDAALERLEVLAGLNPVKLDEVLTIAAAGDFAYAMAMARSNYPGHAACAPQTDGPVEQFDPGSKIYLTRLLAGYARTMARLTSLERIDAEPLATYLSPAAREQHAKNAAIIRSWLDAIDYAILTNPYDDDRGLT